MKKLLLSSIIMFGVCSFASAQTTEGVAAKKAEAKKNANAAAFTNSASVTPQKSASATNELTTVNADGTVGAAVAAPVAVTTERSDADKAKKIEAVKEAEKATQRKAKEN